MRTFALQGNAAVASLGERQREGPVDGQRDGHVGREDEASAVDAAPQERLEGVAAARGGCRRIRAAPGDEVEARREARDHRCGARNADLGIDRHERGDRAERGS